MPPSLAAAARVAAPGLVALAVVTAALADPADYVFVPYPAGVREVSWASGVARGRDGGRESQQVLGLGFTPTDRWYTAAYGAWAADDGAHYQADEWAWVNHVQLTRPNAGPVGVGVLCEVARPHDRGEGTGVRCGPTLQLDTDDLQFNVNPSISTRIHADEKQAATIGYQWQVKGLWRQGIELGAQGFGDFGPLHDRTPGQSQHQLGPAIFAKWALPGGQALHADAAILAGLGGGAPKATLRLRLALSF